MTNEFIIMARVIIKIRNMTRTHRELENAHVILIRRPERSIPLGRPK